MNKTILWLILVVILAVGGFYILNSYIYNEKQADSTMAPYFEERLTTLGIEDVGFPIEGFDANLLIIAFPGLVPADFNNVETLEGYYVVQGETINFIRDNTEQITSAERTIAKKGYATLLENVSTRLNMPRDSESQVLEIIDRINTGERAQAKVGEEVSVFGLKIKPTSVLEDSRCPVDVTCIQAGTVRVSTEVQFESSSSTQVLELNKSLSTLGFEVTLINVDPTPMSTQTKKLSDYVFYFQVIKK